MTATVRQIAEGALFRWGNKLLADHQLAFPSGGHQNHGGSRWVNLAPSTIRSKGHSIILFKTGALERSIQVRVAGLNLIIDSDIPYSFFHQFGTKKMPQRKVIDITDQDIRGLVGELTRSLRGVGFRVTRIS